MTSVSYASSSRCIPSRSNGQVCPIASVELVTPQDAEELLAGNISNYRNLRNVLVRKYAEDMRRGVWTLTTSGIGIDVDGRITNGQHRLNAVMESGVTCWFVVVRNLPKESCHDPNEDTGSRRSVATHLQKLGVASANRVAATARFLIRLRSGDIKRGGSYLAASDAIVSNVVQQNPSIEEAVRKIVSVRLSTPSVAASWYWLASIENRSLADECLEIFAGRVDSFTTHPFAKLREVMIQQKGNTNRTSMLPDVQFSFFCAAWSKAKAGSNVKLLRPSKTIKFSDKADAVLQRIM